MKTLALCALLTLMPVLQAWATLSLPTDTDELQAIEDLFPETGASITRQRLDQMVQDYCTAYMAPLRDAFSADKNAGRTVDSAVLWALLQETHECDRVKYREYRNRYVVVEDSKGAEAAPPTVDASVVQADDLAVFDVDEIPPVIAAAVETMAWKLEKDNLAYRIIPHPSRKYVVFAACGLTLVGASGEELGNEIRPGSCVSEAAAFSPSGDKFAWQNKGDIFVADWTIAGPTNIRSCHGHTRYVELLKFDQSEDLLFSTADDSTTRVWKVSPDACSEANRFRFGGYHVAISNAGTAYVVEDSKLKQVNLLDGSVSDIMSLEGFPTLIYGDESGRLFAGGVAALGDGDAMVAEIDLKERKILDFAWDPNEPRAGSGFKDQSGDTFAISSDGRLLAYVSGLTENHLYLFDTNSRRLILSFEGIATSATSIAFMPGAHSFFLANYEMFYRGEGIFWRLNFEAAESSNN